MAAATARAAWSDHLILEPKDYRSVVISPRESGRVGLVLDHGTLPGRGGLFLEYRRIEIFNGRLVQLVAYLQFDVRVLHHPARPVFGVRIARADVQVTVETGTPDRHRVRQEIRCRYPNIDFAVLVGKPPVGWQRVNRLAPQPQSGPPIARFAGGQQ